jgi:threonine dehydratase
VAFAAKAINPQIRVVGVSMERGAAMHDSLKAGRPMQVAEQRTLADALQGGIGLDNKHTFDLCRRYLDDFVLLTEDEIERCVRTAFYDERLVLEGAGACGFGAITQRAEEYAGAKAATVCSGDNIDPEAFKRLIE